MYKIATNVFILSSILSSILFGVTGILLVLTSGGPNTPDTDLTHFLIKLLFVNVFVILPSFAISIAGKYLNQK